MTQSRSPTVRWVVRWPLKLYTYNDWREGMAGEGKEDKGPNKFGVFDADFDKFGDNLANDAFKGVDDSSLKAEIIKFGEGLSGWQRTVFMKMLRLFFGAWFK